MLSSKIIKGFGDIIKAADAIDRIAGKTQKSLDSITKTKKDGNSFEEDYITRRNAAIAESIPSVKPILPTPTSTTKITKGKSFSDKSTVSSMKKSSILDDAEVSSKSDFKKRLGDFKSQFKTDEDNKNKTSSIVAQTKNTALSVRNNLTIALEKKYGKTGQYADLFDKVDDKAIEENIPLADMAVNSNKSKLPSLSKLPFLRDGLAMSYAAADKNEKTASKVAKELAYMSKSEDDFDNNLVKDAGVKVLGLPEFVENGWNGLKKNVSNTYNDVKQGVKEAWDDWTDNILEAYNDATESFENGDIVSGLFDIARINPFTKLRADALKYGSKEIWKWGAENYLRPRGFDFSAELLEDATSEHPKPHNYDDNSYVAKLLKNDKGFVDKVGELTEKYYKDKSSAKDTYNFEEGDLYYSLHGCTVKISDVKRVGNKAMIVSVNVTDNYDYTKIWTAMKGKGISLGTIANDAGTITTKFDALNEFPINIDLEMRFDL